METTPSAAQTEPFVECLHPHQRRAGRQSLHRDPVRDHCRNRYSACRPHWREANS